MLSYRQPQMGSAWNEGARFAISRASPFEQRCLFPGNDGKEVATLLSKHVFAPVGFLVIETALEKPQPGQMLQAAGKNIWRVAAGSTVAADCQKKVVTLAVPPYPSNWQRVLILKDGSQVFVRPIRSGDPAWELGHAEHVSRAWVRRQGRPDGVGYLQCDPHARRQRTAVKIKVDHCCSYGCAGRKQCCCRSPRRRALGRSGRPILRSHRGFYDKVR